MDVGILGVLPVEWCSPGAGGNEPTASGSFVWIPTASAITFLAPRSSLRPCWTLKLQGKRQRLHGISLRCDGKALFTIPDGCYQVVATSEGLKGQGKNTRLSNAGTVVSLAIEMKLDVMKETLEVSAAQEGFETTESSALGTIESSTIEHAPNVNDASKVSFL